MTVAKATLARSAKTGEHVGPAEAPDADAAIEMAVKEFGVQPATPGTAPDSAVIGSRFSSTCGVGGQPHPRR